MSEWLGLAATPTFVVAALGTAFGNAAGGPADAVCSASAGAAPHGMVVMYALMALFHAAPWARRWRHRAGRAQSTARSSG